uniref:AAA+ ATPase domain-containing protein n=1 Tax=Oryza punctata TaxID=4537 RepID=A0A0E0MJ35_ORYPU
MEAAVVPGILKIVGDKLARLAMKEFSSIMGVTKDLEEIEDLVKEIKKRLQAAGDNAIGNRPSSNWLRNLKNFVYDLEDLVHEFHLEAEKHDEDKDQDRHVVLKHLSTKPKQALFQCKMAYKIKKIKKRFAAIVKKTGDVNTILDNIPVDHNIPNTNKIVKPSSFGSVDGSKIPVRDGEKNMIISRLVEANDQKVFTISIVGLGGTGKTTMAKHIYHDNKIKEHFKDAIFWVDVSQEFDDRKLIVKLFEAISKMTTNLSFQGMVEAISDKLSRKKFLLVLDDAWHKDRYDWEQFMSHLKRRAPAGSRILLTTRDQEVAEAVESICICKLAFLSDEDSWNFFQQTIGLAAEDLSSELIEVGRDIVNKCGGVPLAIKILAGILRHKKTTNHLKQCFAYCSIFPKGYSIYKHQLIAEWIAHGFINPSNGFELVEDIGSGYFDSLLKVHFLQVVDDAYTDYYGGLGYKMHDLVHDLTRQVLQGELVSVSKNEVIGSSQKCRYLSLTSCTGKVDRKLFNKARAVYVSDDKFALNKPIEKGCCTRSVILENMGSTLLSVWIPKFEYLGYLRISDVSCRALPEDISRCWNLQALHVISCKVLERLPESIGKLKKLKTLELFGSDLESLPQSIGDCHNLQSLLLCSCHKLMEIPNSICKIKNLRVLHIINCFSLKELGSEFFRTLVNLECINLAGYFRLQNMLSLACNSLRTLILSGTKVTRLSQCITSVNTLEYIDLLNCRELEELPAGMGKLKRLEVLILGGCYKLGGLPVGFGQLTRLQNLRRFVVGNSGKDARISELGNLNMLSNYLEITNIENVQDPDDAEKACLKEKSGIHNLTLDWFSKGKYGYSLFDTNTRKQGESVSHMEKELRVLNGLEPPSEIKELQIQNYQGRHFSSWMMKQRDSSCLNSLLEQIDPPHFTQLRELVLEKFPNLEFLRGLARLPSLNTLKLIEMPNLVELWTCSGALDSKEDQEKPGCSKHEQVEHCFPCLATLVIRDCAKLKVYPYFPPSLESLALTRSNEQLLSQTTFSHPLLSDDDESSPIWFNVEPSHLKKLKLGGIAATSSGWEFLQNLTSLESLEIEDCGDLTQLPDSIRGLTSMQDLHISYCSDLAMLPEWLGELCSLQTLGLSENPVLTNLPQSIVFLTSLQTLAITQCDALRELPSKGIQHLTSLEELYIHSCRNVSQLLEGIHHLTNLQSLIIENCTALHKLPEGLGMLGSLQVLKIDGMPGLTSLPDALQGLTSLQDLNLVDCPALTMLPESLGQLSTLRYLSIQDCSGLRSLPSSIQSLTSLQGLQITSNPTLSRRYMNRVGTDWHIISHIPRVNIY